MIQGATLHRLTVDDYYRMAEIGILDPQRRYELIDGQIVAVSAESAAHAATCRWLADHFASVARGRFTVSDRHPVRIDGYDEPEPDLSVLRFRADRYRMQHPTPADTLLVVEVARTSLAYDRLTKGRIYARAGVPEYWIVNLEDEAIEVYRDPSGDAYASLERVPRGGTVAPQAFPDVVVDVGAALGESGTPSP